MTNDKHAHAPDDIADWEPSLRAVSRSNSYEEYLALMAQFTRELEHETS